MANENTSSYKRGPYKKKIRETGNTAEGESKTGFPFFGERLKDRLIELNLTQEDLAEAIGMSKGSVSAYINGTQLPPSSCLPALSTFLGLSIDYLFGLNSLSRVDENYKAASKVTGLSDKAIDNLVTLCRIPGISQRAMNSLLESEAGMRMIEDLQYVQMQAEGLQEEVSMVADGTELTKDPSLDDRLSHLADMLRLSVFEFSESSVKTAKTIFNTDEILEMYNSLHKD